MREAVIIDCLRTAVGKAPRGTLRHSRPDDLAAAVIRALLEKYPAAKDGVEDVILGCAMPEGEAGNNMARQAALRAGLPDSVSALTINRFCSSGLQAIAMAADRIRSGGADILVAGGSESMSLTPAGGRKPAPNPWFVDHWPEVYMSMGLTAERVQRKYAVTRQDADAFALASHRKAIEAQQARPLRRRDCALRSRNRHTAGRRPHEVSQGRRSASGFHPRSPRQTETRVPC